MILSPNNCTKDVNFGRCIGMRISRSAQLLCWFSSLVLAWSFFELFLYWHLKQLEITCTRVALGFHRLRNLSSELLFDVPISHALLLCNTSATVWSTYLASMFSPSTKNNTGTINKQKSISLNLQGLVVPRLLNRAWLEHEYCIPRCVCTVAFYRAFNIYYETWRVYYPHVK